MPVKLSDYKPSEYHISQVYLKIDLDYSNTLVTSTLHIKGAPNPAQPLTLNGGSFELKSIYLNQQLLSENEYQIIGNDLTLKNIIRDDFVITTFTSINPTKNTQLEGLYKSADLIITHCEAEGFRNITYYLDRPDVLAPITTEIHANAMQFPVLLGNGNLIKSGVGENENKHFFIYEDLIPKPCYLFALVAGKLACRQDHFVSRSGKEIMLQIFVPEEEIEKTDYALKALQTAMHFDEVHYGREYDLDVYNIVGVRYFNSAAMENKGLNLFKVSSLLTSPSISRDTDFEWVFGTVGHEYFHNWRGNRVTVKNWFQLSLKEGFASITDQEFTQTLTSSMTSRIADVLSLQNYQYPEDSSPLAHPVLPKEYVTSGNIYTDTVYLKGAELLNMLKLLLGQEGYKKACEIYFSKNDGKAVDVNDFISAMELASKRDLSQFLNWYHQAGTPLIEIEDSFDALSKEYHLRFKQYYSDADNKKTGVDPYCSIFARFGRERD